jgi:hypothetical protein
MKTTLLWRRTSKWSSQIAQEEGKLELVFNKDKLKLDGYVSGGTLQSTLAFEAYDHSLPAGHKRKTIRKTWGTRFQSLRLRE